MNKKIILIAMFFFVFSFAYAKNPDLNSLKDKFLSNKTTLSSSSSEKIKGLAEQPSSRFVDPSEKSLSKEDERHVTVHMKLANRHFKNKNYEKAIEEVDKVFERNPSHPGGHFMLAVIAGRRKDYNSAWYHINIAKEKNGSEKKIGDFITKLKIESNY